MRKMTLGTRLTLGGILIVVIPLVIVGVLAVMKASDALTEVSKEQAKNLAHSVAEISQVAISKNSEWQKAWRLMTSPPRSWPR